MWYHASYRAFSLVELSIVLVLLGLITGGVMAGRHLITSSELKSIEASIGKTTSALLSFKQTYGKLPGDINNATDYWPAATSCPNDGTPEETCNGNGDSRIEDATENEIYRVWQHLNFAELWDGNFTGRRDGGINARIGINVPGTKRDGVGFYVEYEQGGFGGINTIVRPESGHYLQLGSVSTGGELQSAALSVTETYMMDKKRDDGLPHLGKMIQRGKYNWNNHCVNSSNDEYNLSGGDELTLGQRTPGCQPIFFLF